MKKGRKLPEVFIKLKEAVAPEDVFGVLSGDKQAKLAAAKKIYRDLTKVTHADSHPDELKKDADKVFKILHVFWEQAKAKIEQGTYGDRTVQVTPTSGSPARKMFTTKKFTYTLLEKIHSGGTSVVFSGVATNKAGQAIPIVVKLLKSERDKDLFTREAEAIEAMREKAKVLLVDPKSQDIGRTFLLRIPDLIESVSIKQPGARSVQQVSVFAHPAGLSKGWFSIEDIRKQYPHGVSTRVMCFIWNRILEGLTLAHLSGVTHGALTPNHVLIHAEEHLGNIIDWTASCRKNKAQSVPYIEERYREYYPPEITDRKGAAVSASDIFMSAWCMVYLLGGDPKEKIIPVSVEMPIRDFFDRCLQPNIRYRPKNAQEAYEAFKAVSNQVFGPRKFVKLEMANTHS